MLAPYRAPEGPFEAEPKRAWTAHDEQRARLYANAMQSMRALCPLNNPTVTDVRSCATRC